MAEMAVSRMFTCFPRLPLEIRNMIWEEAANLPRNLDIWTIPTGNASYSEEDEYGSLVRKEFSFYQYKTRQPHPGVLLATKESRAATHKHFQWSLQMDAREAPVDFTITTYPNVLRNFKADRICPMGRYTEDSALNLWCDEAPPSCAVNIYQSEIHTEKLLFWANNLHEEILLYYCEGVVNISGPFEFVDLFEEEEASSEWEALSKEKQELEDQLQHEIAWKQNRLKKMNKEKGMEPPTVAELNECASYFPKIRLVSLVVDGVRK